MAEGYSMKRRAVSRLENRKSKILPLIIYIIIIQIANIHLNSKLLLAFGLKNFIDTSCSFNQTETCVFVFLYTI
tara:strand:+ start:739 stop:960 length:222 start_codon:yes stop_codon:yes gene_type:complete